MSHEHLRKEKDCLNCGAAVMGEYCQNCGQRNVIPRQTFWHLVTHFFNDLTHFDGKLFTTLKLLLFRPGFLSTEWILGRRTKYLDPIRMYLFISAVCYFTIDSLIGRPPVKYYPFDSPQAILLKQERDSAAAKNEFQINWDSVPGDTTGEEGVWLLSLDNKYMHGRSYYDSLQHDLPPARRPDWLRIYFDHRTVDAYDVYDRNPYAFFPDLIDNLVHSSSKIFFISLPIFAFLLWVFNIRSRKKYYFVSHAIFASHYYSVAFLFLTLFFIGINLLEYTPDNEAFEWVGYGFAALIFLSFPVYLFIAMRRFYQQGWFKTGLKMLMIFLIQCLLLFILLVSFIFNSFFSMGAH